MANISEHMAMPTMTVTVSAIITIPRVQLVDLSLFDKY